MSDFKLEFDDEIQAPQETAEFSLEFDDNQPDFLKVKRDAIENAKNPIDTLTMVAKNIFGMVSSSSMFNAGEGVENAARNVVGGIIENKDIIGQYAKELPKTIVGTGMKLGEKAKNIKNIIADKIETSNLYKFQNDKISDVVPELAKGFANEAMVTTPKIVSDMAYWVGTNMKDQTGKKSNALSDGFLRISETMRNISEYMGDVDLLKSKATELPDGSFSYGQISNLLGHGLGQGAVMVTLARTLGPKVAYGFYAGAGGAEMFKESYEKEGDLGKANTLGTINAASTYMIDRWFDPLPENIASGARMTAKQVVKEVGKTTVKDPLSEGAQKVLSENLVRKIGIDAEQDLYEGVVEEMIGALGGAAAMGGGAIASAYSAERHYQEAKERAVELGADPNDVEQYKRATLAKLQQHPEAFDTVFQQNVEKTLQEIDTFVKENGDTEEVRKAMQTKADLDEVYNRVYEQIKTKDNDKVASAQAKVVQGVALWGAQELGISPLEYFEQRFPTIEKIAYRDFARRINKAKKAGEKVEINLYEALKNPSLLRGSRKKDNRLSLTQFLRNRGGLIDAGGELKSRDASKQVIGLINNKSGIDFDDAALAAWEAGYFPNKMERPTINEFLDAIDDELRGNKKYASELEGVDLEQEVADLSEELDRADIDWRNMEPKEIEMAVDAYLERQRAYLEGMEEEDTGDNGLAWFQGKLTDSVRNFFKPLAKDISNFRNFFKKAIRGEVSENTILQVSERTPEVYKRLGFDDKPMGISNKTIKKANIDKHNVPLDVLEELPEFIFDPVAVLDSKTRDGSLVSILNAVDNNGDTVVAIIKPTQGKYNIIPSVYGKDDLDNLIKSSNIRYKDIERANLVIRPSSLQLLGVDNTVGSLTKSSMTQNEQNVNRTFYQGGEDIKDLYATHNMGLQGVKNALKMGGLAMPSLAMRKVSQGDINQFGDIVFVANERLAAPARGIEVYDRDAWTPNLSSAVRYDLKPEGRGFIKRVLEKHGRAMEMSMFSYNIEENISYPTSNTMAMELYELDKGLEKSYSAYNSQEYLDWYEENITGNSEPYLWTENASNTDMVRKKFTLDNMMKILRKQEKSGGGFIGDYIFDVYKLLNFHSQKFKNLKEIKKNKHKLVTPTEQKEALKTLNDDFLALSEELKKEGEDYGFGDATYGLGIALIQDSDEQIAHWLDYKNLQSDEKAIQKVKDFIERMKDIPTDYFEVKPRRIVDFSEFSGVIIPKGKEYDNVAETLARQHYLTVERVEKGNNEEYDQALHNIQANAETTFFQFAGPNAKTAALDQLKKAKQLEKNGINNETIRQQTGWFKGIDGKWRFEISDKDADFANGYNPDEWKKNGVVFNGLKFKLGKILKHDNLFAAYPQLKDVVVEYTRRLSDGALGNFTPSENKIYIDSTMSADKIKDVLLHEIQHAIQVTEGFAMGGSEESVVEALRSRIMRTENSSDMGEFLSWVDEYELLNDVSTIIRLSENPESLTKTYWFYERFLGTPKNKKDRKQFLDEKGQEFLDFMREKYQGWGEKTYRYHEYLQKDKAEIDKMRKSASQKVDRLHKKVYSKGYLKAKDLITKFQDNEISAFTLYKRLYGEIEARNTQARANMSDEERRATPIEETQDIKNADAIVMFSDGTAIAYKSANQDKNDKLYRDPKGAFSQRINHRALISMFERADASTFMHETAHFFFEELKAFAKTSKKSAEMLDTINKWLGSDGTTYTEAQIEQFARGFEQYLREGKAPSKYLKRVFDAFMSWMRNLYKTARELNVQLNDDVRSVYANILGGTELDKYMDLSPAEVLGSTKKYWKAKREAMDEIYAQNNQAKKTERRLFGKVGQSMQKVYDGMRDYLSDAIVPLEEEIKQISPDLYNMNRRLEIGKLQKTSAYYRRIKGFVEGMNKMNETDFHTFDLALKNRDVDTVDRLLTKYKLDNGFAEVRRILDDLREQMIDVGVDVAYMPDYFPRKIKDADGLLDYVEQEFGDRQEYSIIQKMIEEKRKDGRIRTKEDEAQIVNSLIRGYAGGISIAKIGNVKERSIDVIDQHMNKYYKVSSDALVDYVSGAVQMIEDKKYFGRETKELQNLRRMVANRETTISEYEAMDPQEAKWKEIKTRNYKIGAVEAQIRNTYDNGVKAELTDRKTKLEAEVEYLKDRRADQVKEIAITRMKVELAQVKKEVDALADSKIENSVGNLLLEMAEQGKISHTQELRLKELLLARFSNKGLGNEFLRIIRDGGYIWTLGNFESAITQFGDLGTSAYKNGLWNTAFEYVKAWSGKSEITIEDLGLGKIIQDGGYADTSAWSQALDKVLKYTGFEKMDKIAKQTLVNSAIRKAREQAKAESPELEQYLRHEFEEKWVDVKEDLKTGAITDEIIEYAMFQLLDVQPITIDQMPRYYAEGGKKRLFYMMKSYFIKQLNEYRKVCFETAKTDPRKAVVDMLRLTAYLMLFNAGADLLKDLLFGRPINVADTIVDNIFIGGSINRYQAMSVKREGLFRTLQKQLLFPVMMDELIIDAFSEKEIKDWNTWKNIPLVGRPYYWWFGGGHLKTEKEIKKQRNQRRNQRRRRRED